jgi:hypothetical protein
MGTGTLMGNIHIMVEVSMQLTCLTIHRSGYLEQTFHSFTFLKVNPKKTFVMYSQHPGYNENQFSLVCNGMKFIVMQRTDTRHSFLPRMKGYLYTVLLMHSMTVIALRQVAHRYIHKLEQSTIVESSTLRNKYIANIRVVEMLQTTIAKFPHR